MPSHSVETRKTKFAKLIVTGAITVVVTIVITLLSATGGGFASDGNAGTRRWTLPIIIHVATVLPAIIIGAAVLMLPKGTKRHKIAGRVYAALLLITATATLFIGTPGSGIAGSGFSFLHIFTAMAFTSLPYAIWAARTGRITAHRDAMQGMYVGLCIAGGFAFLPGRLLMTTTF